MCQNCETRLNGEKATVIKFSRKNSRSFRLCAEPKACNRRRRALDAKRYPDPR
jgi:hypothetical protein